MIPSLGLSHSLYVLSTGNFDCTFLREPYPHSEWHALPQQKVTETQTTRRRPRDSDMRLTTTRASSKSLLALFFAVVLLLLQGNEANAGCTKVSRLISQPRLPSFASLSGRNPRADMYSPPALLQYCSKGLPCGDTCIAQGETCHKTKTTACDSNGCCLVSLSAEHWLGSSRSV